MTDTDLVTAGDSTENDKLSNPVTPDTSSENDAHSSASDGSLATMVLPELRALANLEEAKANYERAVGRTLEVNRVTIADAKSGEAERETLIPGTLHGQVVGTEKLSFNAGQK